MARSTTAVVCYRIPHWLFENYGLDERATGVDWKGYPQKWQALSAFQCETTWSPPEKQFGGIPYRVLLDYCKPGLLTSYQLQMDQYSAAYLFVV